MDNVGYNTGDKDRNAAPLFSEVNSIYAYQEPDEDVELFVSPSLRSASKWKQECRVLRYSRFWIAMITWIGIKTGMLFFWILVPVLYLKRGDPDYVDNWVILPVAAGVGSLIPSIASCWTVTTTVQYRRLYFGGACWLGSIITKSYYSFLMCSLLGGISISGLLSCQDLTLCDVLGSQFARRSHKLFSTFVGIGVLTFCFVYSENVCLRAIASLQFLGGCYWVLPSIWDIIQARRYREG